MIRAKLDISDQDGITFTHYQHKKGAPTIRLDLWQGDNVLGNLELTREQALDLRAVLNDWASFYGLIADPSPRAPR